MSINIQLLKEICETPGAPGFEQKVRELVYRELEGVVDELYNDNMGNVYAVKKGKQDKRVMIGAHMDEIGFIVSHIDDKGFIRFHCLGGFDPKTHTAQRVIIHGKEDVIGVMSSKPIHVMKPEERNVMPKNEDFFIDTGMSKEEVEALVKVGDPITRQRELIEMGPCVNCKSIDNRVAVFILIEMMKELKGKEVPYDIYGVFTVQEEVGIRGANVAALNINPDFGFGLDTTIAYDLPGAQAHEMITKLGEGTAIKILDGRTICDYRMVQYMREIADKEGIKWQNELLPAGGTDTAGIQQMTAGGSIAGAVSVPTRHLHQVIEMANKEDIRASIDLLKAVCAHLDQYDWSFK